jgi:hypothetical protein
VYYDKEAEVKKIYQEKCVNFKGKFEDLRERRSM